MSTVAMICFSSRASSFAASFRVTHLYVLNFEKSVFLSKLLRTSWPSAVVVASRSPTTEKNRTSFILTSTFLRIGFQIQTVNRVNIRGTVRSRHSPDSLKARNLRLLSGERRGRRNCHY